jgi:hypothetical protein
MIPNRSLYAIAGAAACAALSGGCVMEPPLSWYRPQTAVKYTIEDADKFEPLDEFTYELTSCTGLRENTLPDGRLEVVADVRNRGSEPISIQARCVFETTDGVSTRNLTPWQALVIAPNAAQPVKFTADTAMAKRYVIRVRRAR